MKFGTLMQNDMRITAIQSTSQPKEKFQYGGRLFLQTSVFPNRKQLYLSRELRYVDEIWFADRL